MKSITDSTPRKFAPGLTHSVAHHLLAVSELIDKNGYARVSDIARQLEITRGSVSVSMQSLKSHGYVDQDENRFFRLTDRGRRAAESIRARHKVVEEFLVEVLGLPQDKAHQESCRVEHLIEAPVARRLYALVRFWNARGLGEAFEAECGDECPACGGAARKHCPCCSLECLDGDCAAVTGSE